MGRRRAAAFRKVGIANIKDLDRCDVTRLVGDLRATGHPVSPAQIEQLRLHARCYREERAILFGEPPPVGDSFIALDLEYDLFSHRLWLIGLCLVEAGRREYVLLWAEDRAGERAGMERLMELLEETGGLPVLTWGGTSADLPQLRQACKRLGFKGMLDRLEDRHVDLFAATRQILRLPVPELGLGEVAGFFGVAKSSSTIGDGREAKMMFSRYLSTYRYKARARLKQELLAYNRDDLDALIETLRAIQALPIESEMAPGGQSLLSPACTPSSPSYR